MKATKGEINREKEREETKSNKKGKRNSETAIE